jgi:hypothetical protein
MTHPTTKLAPKWYGPFKIKKKISDIVFQLELPHQWKIHNVFHTFLLTPYIKTELYGPNFPEPPLEIVKGDPEFKVEQIVGSRRTGKKETLQYKVRWKGYSPAHDSWEPVKQVHTPELIKKFQKTESSQKNNATINYQAALGILSRPSPPKEAWGCLPLPEAESLLTEPKTDKGSRFGNRTQDSPTT